MSEKYAFPVAWPGNQAPDTGMTLRQWYAGLAMQGMLANPIHDEDTFKVIALSAWDMADAMLAEEDA